MRLIIYHPWSVELQTKKKHTHITMKTKKKTNNNNNNKKCILSDGNCIAFTVCSTSYSLYAVSVVVCWLVAASFYSHLKSDSIHRKHTDRYYDRTRDNNDHNKTKITNLTESVINRQSVQGDTNLFVQNTNGEWEKNRHKFEWSCKLYRHM